MQVQGEVISVERVSGTKTDVRVVIEVGGAGFAFVTAKGGFNVGDNVTVDINVVP